jgi:flavin reductase (DIM6/NTAB) family NADH-FMN oxidoreductase RutF
VTEDLDLAAADAVLSGLRPFPVAVTTTAGGRANGLISLSAGSGSVLREAPRVQISLAKRNLTHDLVKESGVFAMHLLAGGDDDVLAASLAIIMTLGGSSGRDGDKIAQLATKPGVTGSPILTDALSYV